MEGDKNMFYHYQSLLILEHFCRPQKVKSLLFEHQLDFLSGFPGCLLLVSHDRYFMDKLVEQLFVLEGEGVVKEFYGNYTDYRESKDAEPIAIAPKKEKYVAATPIVEQEPKKKLSYKEQREFDDLEKAIPQLEQQKTQLTDKINGGSTNYEELSTWAKEIETINQQLDEKTLRWMELSEMI